MSGRFQILDLPSGSPLFQSSGFASSPLFLRHTLGLPALSLSASGAGVRDEGAAAGCSTAGSRRGSRRGVTGEGQGGRKGGGGARREGVGWQREVQRSGVRKQREPMAQPLPLRQSVVAHCG